MVFAIQGRAVRDPRELSLFQMLLGASLSAVLFSFVPLLVDAAGSSSPWRLSNGGLALSHLGGLLLAGRSLRGAAPSAPALLRALPVLATGAVVLLQLAAAAGWLQERAFFVYLVGLVWALTVAAVAFGALLFGRLAPEA